MEWQLNSEYSARQPDDHDGVDWEALRFYLRRCTDTVGEYEGRELSALGYRLTRALELENARLADELAALKGGRR